MVHELKTALIYNMAHIIILLFVFPTFILQLLNEGLLTTSWLIWVSIINALSKTII